METPLESVSSWQAGGITRSSANVGGTAQPKDRAGRAQPYSGHRTTSRPLERRMRTRAQSTRRRRLSLYRSTLTAPVIGAHAFALLGTDRAGSLLLRRKINGQNVMDIFVCSGSIRAEDLAKREGHFHEKSNSEFFLLGDRNHAIPQRELGAAGPPRGSIRLAVVTVGYDCLMWKSGRATTQCG